VFEFASEASAFELGEVGGRAESVRVLAME
jgi:hypothetical protein